MNNSPKPNEIPIPFQQGWEMLPKSVQNRVRSAIVMVGVWMFLMGVLFGVFAL